MTDEKDKEGMLSPYRVLDLTDERGLLSAKLMGDLGADVIKIEKPEGDATRRIGPFFHDSPDPEKSLFWFAYNNNKRGITLDIEKPESQSIFKDLAKGSDFIFESFTPGYMKQLGLGYADLKKINPGLIMVSITPFGQTGPYSRYKGPDLVTWAMSGRMYGLGDADRPPIRISHQPQTYLQAGIEGAAAATIALYHRNRTGEGQHIDLSIQAAAAQSGDTAFDQSGLVRPRRAGMFAGSRITVNRTWQCKEGGLITWIFMPGSFEGKKRNSGLVQWMVEEDMATDFLKNMDWEAFDYQTVTQDVIDQIEAPTRHFFLAHTKSQLLAGAVKYRVLFYPQFTTADILTDVQLMDRGFWKELPHPELGTIIKYPGAFAVASETPARIRRRAPRIGEHNQAIYAGELHFSQEKITKLKETGVI